MGVRTPTESIYSGSYSYQVSTQSVTPGLSCLIGIKQLNYILAINIIYSLNTFVMEYKQLMNNIKATYM